MPYLVVLSETYRGQAVRSGLQDHVTGFFFFGLLLRVSQRHEARSS